MGAFELGVTFDQASLPDGAATVPYNQTLTATRQPNGTSVAAFSLIAISGQSLPPGLALAADGTLSGTPTAAGTYTFTVKAADADGMAGAQRFALTINEPVFAPAAISGRVTFGGNPLAGVNVTLTRPDNTTAAMATGADGRYSFASLPAGSYTVTPAKTNFTFTPAGRPVALSGADAAGVDFVASSTLANPRTAGGALLISEFRLRGPAPASPLPNDETGERDEFVELYNNTDAPMDISGYRLDTSAGLTVTVPTGTNVPARGHYLIANADGYSLAGYGGADAAAPDLTYGGFDLPADAGLALLDASGQMVDAVGFAGTPAPYFEGTVRAAVGGAGEYSFVRRLAGATPQDTGDNAGDFVLVSTDGAVGAAPATLGAPGPEGLSSPVVLNSRFGTFLLDATRGSASPPNRVRNFAMNPAHKATFGAMSIRRRFTNNTGAAVTRLRLRVISVTGFPVADPAHADLRVISSADTSADVNDPATCSGAGLTAPCTVTVLGTTLETPPGQPNGGGLNSSLSVDAVTSAPAFPVGRPKAGRPVVADTIDLAAPLADGASINVQFLLGVQKTGKFRFYLNLEALP